MRRDHRVSDDKTPGFWRHLTGMAGASNVKEELIWREYFNPDDEYDELDYAPAPKISMENEQTLNEEKAAQDARKPKGRFETEESGPARLHPLRGDDTRLTPGMIVNRRV